MAILFSGILYHSFIIPINKVRTDKVLIQSQVGGDTSDVRNYINGNMMLPPAVVVFVACRVLSTERDGRAFFRTFASYCNNNYQAGAV